MEPDYEIGMHNKTCPACGKDKLWYRSGEIISGESEGMICKITFSCMYERCRKIFTETYLLVYRGTDQTGDPRTDERTLAKIPAKTEDTITQEN